MTRVERIVKADLCLGCGLCQSVSGGEMHINEKGFYTPDLKSITQEADSTIDALCPGVNIINRKKTNDKIWGQINQAVEAWATDPEIRYTSSSGGVTTALAIYLLETGSVNGVLQIGNVEGDYLHNRLYISRTRADVLRHNSSRYAPVALLSEILQILRANPTESYAFVGKPCDISAIRNIQSIYPEIGNRIKYCLAIFCAGMPSYKATEDALATFGRTDKPIGLKYRGDGWPGEFRATYADQTTCGMSYNDSWGKILGRQLGLRCKICPDGIGMLADIASGDSWNTKDGYPDFTEADGRNFCLVRTEAATRLIEGAKKAGYIEVNQLNISNVKETQPYQYNRRRYVGWRIAVIQLLTHGLIKLKGLSVYRLAMMTDIKKGLRESLGTWRRFKKANG